MEGNYWSDYNGVDDGSGSGKHANAWDGIGDTQIPHPATSYDFYPLVYAYTVKGDINGNFVVNILDALILSNAYGSNPGSPNWKPCADINKDQKVNFLDAMLVSVHYLEHFP